MSIADFFKQGNKNAPTQPTGMNAGNNPGAGASLEAAKGNIDNAAGNMQGAGVADNTPPAPMDGFKSLWENTNDEQVAKPAGFLPEITAEQLNKALANSNFLSTVSPELLAKASSGDSVAFSDVINQGLRSVMAQSVLASRGLVEAGTKSHGEQLRTSLPTMVRSSNVSDSLQKNPLYNNPAVKPVIDNVRAQLETKHPTASAKEIADLTDAYFADLSKAMSGGSGNAGGDGQGGVKQQQGETDWYAMLGLDK